MKQELKVSELTALDFIAIEAMNGSLSNPNGGGSFSDMAKFSYEYAKAMLAERERLIDNQTKTQ